MEKRLVFHHFFQFDYASYGRGARSLSVYIAVADAFTTINRVYTHAGFGPAQPWTRDQFIFQEPASSYRIVIEAKFTSRSSVIAMDNVVLVGENGKCPFKHHTRSQCDLPTILSAFQERRLGPLLNPLYCPRDQS